MALHSANMDEFMLSAFARMWEVRVAVLRREGKDGHNGTFPVRAMQPRSRGAHYIPLPLRATL